jgi:hypothetical protein
VLVLKMNKINSSFVFEPAVVASKLVLTTKLAVAIQGYWTRDNEEKNKINHRGVFSVFL